MRILFLTDNFPPEGNAPATRTYEHAVRWVRAGHEVTVITCAPNFPEGKLFPGYRNAWRSVETLDGIRVVRVKTYITANEGFLKRTLDYLSFMAAGTVAGLFERRHDVVVATSPQFFCALGGWALARLKRRPFVFELRDLWPASITAVGAMQRSAAIRALEKLEMFLYRSADAIVPVTQSFREELIQRGVDADKIHVVLNGVDLQRYRPAARDEAMAMQYDLDGRFVVGYLGTHGMAHGLEKVIEAAERLRDDPRIVFFFAGSGAQRAHVERMAAERALPNVRMIPRQPKDMMPRLWGLCDLSLIPLRDTPVFASVIPSKLFEGMGMGIPALMSLPRGEAVRIVESTGCGVCVAPEDAAAMADEIAALAGDPERMRRLREASLAAAPAYSRDRQARLMSDALARLVDDDGARGLLRTPE
ncbi:glycosyltransferase family 4 protein [Lysobacter enzymogenes]|uniref:Glycosyltransferase WbuB n=1 Tax=Lysobacter enzymogenes TaxID=69 RepID=A0A3N2RGB1_LYSEN|nr:glycosyltransferase family 4 protein [Lysobacter enzymogenes]ROU06503.1 glycosyltransferase WbuB [Lysobacter enzymogenes]UZY45304.1 glycosyltransferase [Lysobacter enzymogenes]